MAAWQPGHLYLGTWVLHTQHKETAGAQQGTSSPAATDTICRICCCLLVSEQGVLSNYWLLANYFIQPQKTCVWRVT